MSSNKTEHYELHAWEPEDIFQLSEINENFTALDASARVICGTYKATGSGTGQTIELGVHPVAVLVFSEYGPVASSITRTSGLAIRERGVANGSMTLTETGFTVGTGSVDLNLTATDFIYVAFY